MIDDKKIEDAAKAYSKNNACSVIDRNGYMSLGPELENAFETGAHWALKQFLKDLWHPNTEEPNRSKSDVITLDSDNGAYLLFKESVIWSRESWRHAISRCQITKWAYLSNILPKQEGGEQ